MATRRVLFVLIAVAVLLPGLFPTSVAATDQFPPPDRDRSTLQATVTGGLTWSFSRRSIFADERVATALAILIDEAEVTASAGVTGLQLGYADEAVRTAAEGQPPDLAGALLAASGVATPGGNPVYEQVRRCRIWTPPGAASADTDAVAAALSAALVDAFFKLDILIDPCEAASTAADADIFLSTADLVVDDPSFLVTDADSFLGFSGGQVDPGTGGVGGGGGVPANGGPIPADSGNVGIADRSGDSLAVTLLMVALATIAVFGSRRATHSLED